MPEGSRKKKNMEGEHDNILSTSTFGLDLDGRSWDSANKKELPARIRELQPVLRLWRKDRVLSFVHNMVFDFEQWFNTVNRFRVNGPGTAVSQAEAVRGLDKLVPLMHLPLFTPEEEMRKVNSRLHAALLGKFTPMDYRVICILDFLPVGRLPANGPPMGSYKPDERRALAEAVANFSVFMEAVTAAPFKRAFADLVEELQAEFRTWYGIESCFIRHMIEIMIATAWSDIREMANSIEFPLIKMKSGEGCAELMKAYAERMIKSAREKSGEWAPDMRLVFHLEGGAYAMTRFRVKPNGGVKGEGKPKGGGLKEERPNHVAKKDQLCFNHAGNVLGCKGAQGAVLACTKPGCAFFHPASKAEITGTAMDNMLKGMARLPPPLVAAMRAAWAKVAAGGQHKKA